MTTKKTDWKCPKGKKVYDEDCYNCDEFKSGRCVN